MAQYRLDIDDMAMGPHCRMWPRLAAFSGQRRRRVDAIKLLLEKAVWEYCNGRSIRDTRFAWDVRAIAQSFQGVKHGHVWQMKCGDISLHIYREA